VGKRIINCFYESSNGGIGDFLRGSLFLYNYCKNRKIDFFISLKHHKISKYIKTIKDFDYEESEILDITKKVNSSGFVQLSSVENFYKRVGEETKKQAKYRKKFNNFIYTNYSNLFELRGVDVIAAINNSENLSRDCKDWFKKNLVFSQEIKEESKKQLEKVGLSDKDFNIMHFRIGDEKSFFGLDYSSAKVDFNNMLELCKRNIKIYGLPLLILSDNNELKSFLSLKSKEDDLPIYVTHLKSKHSQKNPNIQSEKYLKTSDDGNFHIATDMYLITQATRINSNSVYFWGSGFITWIAKIYDIPINIRSI
jgi:hypothetical protein